MKKIYILCISLLVLVSCKSNSNIQQQMSVNYIKPPKWVTQETHDFLSAVGVTNGEESLIKAKPLAEQNAIENLKFNIILHVESFIFDETKKLDVKKRKKLIDDFKSLSQVFITEEFLQLVSRQDEMWKSPNTNVLYVKVVADGKQVSVKMISIIEELQRKYDYDNEILSCLLKMENDILRSKTLNLTSDKKNNSNQSEAKILDKQKQIKNITNENNSQQNSNVEVKNDDKNKENGTNEDEIKKNDKVKKSDNATQTQKSSLVKEEKNNNNITKDSTKTNKSKASKKQNKKNSKNKSVKISSNNSDVVKALKKALYIAEQTKNS